MNPTGNLIDYCRDHPYAIEVAQAYGMEKHTKVVARKHEKQPIHLDKVLDLKASAAEFYDTFVDVLMLRMGKCATYNRGGFGHWGLLIGYNSSCHLSQKTSVKGIGVMCNWTETANTPQEHAQGSKAPLFLEPMGETLDEVAPI